MGKTRKTNLARKARKNLAQKEGGWMSMSPKEALDVWSGGTRHGNKRKTMATLKKKESKRLRAKEKSAARKEILTEQEPGSTQKTPGKFIVVEGIDGSGKTNVINAIVDAIKTAGHDVLQTRQPGGTRIGEQLRTILKEWEPLPRTEALLFAASFQESLEGTILPALKAGTWVVSDRWTGSTQAYQSGGRGLPETEVARILKFASPTEPDLWVFCDTNPNTAKSRMDNRGEPQDRFDSAGDAFHQKVYSHYKKLSKNPNWKTIPTGKLTPQKCAEAAKKATSKLLKN